MLKAYCTLLVLSVSFHSVAAQGYQPVVHNPPACGAGPVFVAENRSGSLSEWRAMRIAQERCNYTIGDERYYFNGADHYRLDETQSVRVKDREWVIPARAYTVWRAAVPGVGYYSGLRNVPWKVEYHPEGERYFFLGWIRIDTKVFDVWCEFQATPAVELPAPEALEVPTPRVEQAPSAEPEWTPIPQKKRPTPTVEPLPADPFLAPEPGPVLPLPAPVIREEEKPTERIEFDGPVADMGIERR